MENTVDSNTGLILHKKQISTQEHKTWIVVYTTIITKKTIIFKQFNYHRLKQPEKNCGARHCSRQGSSTLKTTKKTWAEAEKKWRTERIERGKKEEKRGENRTIPGQISGEEQMQRRQHNSRQEREEVSTAAEERVTEEKVRRGGQQEKTERREGSKGGAAQERES